MKRVLCLAASLLLLAGCRAGLKQSPEETSAVKTSAEENSSAENPTEKAVDWVGSDYFYNGDPDARFPLYAELPDDGIQLYGVDGSLLNSMVLYHKGVASCFDNWGYCKYDYPRIAFRDFDGDGKKDIGAITLAGSGTGLLLTELHIVTIEKELAYESGGINYYDTQHIDHVFATEDVEAYFKKNVNYKHNKQANTLDIEVSGQSYTAALEPDLNWTGELSVNSHIYFDFTETGIQLTIYFSVFYSDGIPDGDVVARCTANVTFDGAAFALQGLQLGEIERPSEVSD